MSELSLYGVRFYKEKYNRWYVDLPEWKGSKEDLEMVMGADVMLDFISNFKKDIKLDISTYNDNYKYKLVLIEKLETGGANYHFIYDDLNFIVWLCDVTLFVFKSFPQTIYIN